MLTPIRTKTLLLASLSLAAAAALLLSNAAPSRGGAPDVTLAIGSATVLPAGSTTVDFTVTPGPGVIAAAMDVNIDYDPAVLDPIACTSSSICNTAFDPDTVRIGLVDLLGHSGVEGSITFTAIGANGTSSVLDVVIVVCVDDFGDPLNCADSDGLIAVSAPTPTPSPSPSPTPSPTPTPPPLTWGDVDCSNVINAVDALAILRWKASLTYTSAPGCPGIGVPMLPTLWGDVNCTGAVNAVDSLAILRWKAGLTVLQTQPCPVIGAPYP